MSEQPSERVSKVTLYVTHGARLLVFLEPKYPQILLQVPGGTVEPGEDIDAAAHRELSEETGLVATGALHALGQSDYHFRYRGLNQMHRRHYFHLALSSAHPVAERWSHTEMNSSLRVGPIEFALFWLDLEQAARDLGYGFGEKLPALRARMAQGHCL